jgi:hypothetical protein
VDEEELDEQIEETFNLNDITQLYTTPTETPKDIMDTSKLISDAINDKKWMTKTVKEYKYDDTYENISYDARLEDVYNKYYIRDCYIYKDDTIKNMRYNVISSLELDPDSEFKDLPSIEENLNSRTRLYLLPGEHKRNI